MKIVDGLRYTTNHEWVLVDGESARMVSPIMPKMRWEPLCMWGFQKLVQRLLVER